jgi:hypothetical protein
LTENDCKAAAERLRRGLEDLVSNGIVQWHSALFFSEYIKKWKSDGADWRKVLRRAFVHALE